MGGDEVDALDAAIASAMDPARVHDERYRQDFRDTFTAGARLGFTHGWLACVDELKSITASPGDPQ